MLNSEYFEDVEIRNAAASFLIHILELSYWNLNYPLRSLELKLEIIDDFPILFGKK